MVVPWSAFFPAIAKLHYRPVDRAGSARLLALCWTGFLLLFFTFSTTQEYYSMPCYPALALLLANALEREESVWLRRGQLAVGLIATLAAGAIGFILFRVNGLPTPGDISQALTQNPDAYTLSLGHMGDLTIDSFAYLRLPLVMAGVAFLIGAFAAFRLRRLPLALGLAVMMTLFLHAARTALVTFDPYLGSRPLAEAYKNAKPGTLIVDNQYYTFSSVFFYANPAQALLLNGRVNNLEYASYAPGAPQVFIDDAECKNRWASRDRYYLIVEKPSTPRLEQLLGRERLFLVRESGGKYLFSNEPN